MTIALDLGFKPAVSYTDVSAIQDTFSGDTKKSEIALNQNVSPIPTVRSRNKTTISPESQQKLQLVENIKLGNDKYIRLVKDPRSGKSFYIFNSNKTNGSGYRYDVFPEEATPASRNEAISALLKNNPDLKTFITASASVPAVTKLPSVRPRPQITSDIQKRLQFLQDLKLGENSYVRVLKDPQSGKAFYLFNSEKPSVGNYKLSQYVGLYPEEVGQASAKLSKETALHFLKQNPRLKTFNTPIAIKNTAAVTTAPVKSVAGKLKSPFDGEFFAYGAVGLQRPTSLAVGATKKAFITIASKVPGLSVTVKNLDKLLYRGDPDKADLMRLEANTFTPNGAKVLNIKFNLSQLMKGPRELSDKIFDEFKNRATNPLEKTLIEEIRTKVNSGRQKGLADSTFAKQTDLRFTFDIGGKNPGMRAGLLTVPWIKENILGKKADFLIAVSPRAMFSIDPKTGHPKFVGGQFIVVAELDTLTSKKTSLWAGLGAGGYFQWNGGIENSPVRTDAKGNLGIEVSFKNEARFLAVPDLKKTMAMNGFPDGGSIKQSNAPRLDGESVAKEMLNINDPKILENAQNIATKVEQGAEILDTATNAVTVGSTVATVGTLASGLSLGSLMIAGAGGLALAALWPSADLADGTIDGSLRASYKAATQNTMQELNKINQRLSQDTPLTKDERTDLQNSIDKIRAIGLKWSTNENTAIKHPRNYKQFYESLPIDKRTPWDIKSTQLMQSVLNNHK
jgi:hypothetical protein